MTQTRLSLYLWLAVSVVAFGGCVGAVPSGASKPDATGGATQSATPGATDPLPDGATAPQLALFPPDEEGAGALLTGVLRRNGPCLNVVGEDGESWLTAWPATASWDAEGQKIRFGGTEVGLGDVAVLGGGEQRIESSKVDDYEWIERPNDACLPALVWFVYTLQSET